MPGPDGLLDVENLFRDEQKKVKKRKKAAKATLSFALDDEEEAPAPSKKAKAEADSSGTPTPADGDEEQPAKRTKFKKNPTVDTSFLPDRDREEADRREREALRKEWLKRQEEMKQEEIEIVYSYWDGSGHRKSVIVSPLYSLLALHGDQWLMVMFGRGHRRSSYVRLSSWADD